MMDELQIVTADTKPFELLVRLTEALAALQPEERLPILRAFNSMGARFIYAPKYAD